MTDIRLTPAEQHADHRSRPLTDEERAKARFIREWTAPPNHAPVSVTPSRMEALRLALASVTLRKGRPL